MRPMKIFVGSLLCLLNTALLVTNKVFLIYLLALKGSHVIYAEQWYAAIASLLLVPEIFGFLILLWNTSFFVRGQIKQWPAVGSILAGILSGILEASSLTVFAFEVAPHVPSYVLVPLLGSVMSLQNALRSWNQKRKQKVTFAGSQVKDERSIKSTKSSLTKRCVMVSCALLGIATLIAIACILTIQSVIKLSQAVCFVSSILTLSFVWCPSIQLFTLRSADGSYNGRNRGALVYTFFKLLALVMGTMVVVMMSYKDVSFDGAAYGLVEGLKFIHEPSLFYPVLIACLSALVSFCVSSFSAYSCVPFAGVTVPAILSTPAASGVCIYLCVYSVFPLSSEHICSFTTHTYVTLILAGLGWMVPFLLFGIKLQKSSTVCMKPRHENFISCTWNNVFLEQQTMLSYKHDGIHKNDGDDDEMADVPSNKTSRVFICTTMYREADYEMERLLSSIQRLALSKRLNNVYLESHLFLDNGAKKLKLTEFALQLLSLLESKLEVHKLDCVTSETPYGLQLQWVLPGNMPFFVHLKDSNKFKPKKRWSQVMYMKYILNYRVRKSRERWEIVELDGGTEFYKIRKNASASTLDTIYIDEIPIRYTASMASFGAISRNSKLEEEALKTLEQQGRRGSATSIDQGIEMGDEQSSLSSGSSNQNKASQQEGAGEAEMKPDCADNSDNKILHEQISTRNEMGMTNPGFQDDNHQQITSVKENDTNRAITDASGRYSDLGKLTNEQTATFSRVSIVVEDMSDPTSDNVSQRIDFQQPDVITRCNSSNNIFVISGSMTEERKYDMPDDDVIDDQTYILATDADMEFKDTSLLSVLEACNQDKRLGGACGRTYPVGKKNGPIVWFQMFEYAKDFWMIKSAQNVIGSVMCCPGCFSLYRANALEQALVEYKKPTDKAFDVFIKDTGEDRWMCTLMMMRGWRLKYISTSLNTTHCPDKFDEFLKQRRRWILSDMANTILVSKNLRNLSLQNPCFSLMYIFYMLQMFVVVLLSPGSTIVMLTAGLDMVLSIPFHFTTPFYGLALILYTVVCVSRYTKLQTASTMVLMLLLAVNITIVVIGGGIFITKDVMRDIAEGTLQFQEHYILIMLMASLIYAALLHPRETWILLHGLSYMLFFPAMHILMPLYAISNIVDQSWGTRDNQKAKIPKLSCFPIRRKLKKKKKAKREGAKKTGETESANSVFPPMSDGNYHQQDEFRFWSQVKEQFLGNDVNLGLGKEELATGLRCLRMKAVVGMLLFNGVWLCCLSVLFWYTSTGQTKVNAYGLICGVLYGFSFTIQVLGMTTYRAKVAINYITKKTMDLGQRVWVTDLVQIPRQGSKK